MTQSLDLLKVKGYKVEPDAKIFFRFWPFGKYENLPNVLSGFKILANTY